MIKKIFKINYIIFLNILLLFTLFMPLFNIRAEQSDGYVSGDEVNFRSLPTTKNSDIIDTLAKNTKIDFISSQR